MLCSDINYNNPINIEGLCDNLQEVRTTISEFPYWTERVIQELVAIPGTSPRVSEVNSVNISINIIRKEVIVTPIASIENIEGKFVTGRKVVLEGQLCQIIEYTTVDPYDQLRTMTVYNPFSAYIVVPKEVDINGELIDSLSVNFDIYSCVEDLNVNNIDGCKLLKTVSVLFYAIPNNL